MGFGALFYKHASRRLLSDLPIYSPLIVQVFYAYVLIGNISASINFNIAVIAAAAEVCNIGK